MALGQIALAPIQAFAQDVPDGAVQAVPPPVGPPVSAAGLPDTYRINAGDELEIYVWGEEPLQRTTTVLPDGSFSFPLVGRIVAAGKLPSEVEADVSKGLAPQFRTNVPQVTVSVRQASGMTISVLGKVRSPGTFTPGKYINVLQALTLAGGPADFANVGAITILRQEGGQLVPIKVKLSKVLNGSASAQELSAGAVPMLQSGDTVVVP